MSVIVIGRFKANPADLEKVMAERAADFVAVSNEAKGVGGLHHQFGSADGEVIIIDEWDSVDSFQKFFQSNTVIPQIMQDAGVQGAPEFSFYESMDSPDRF